MIFPINYLDYIISFDSFELLMTTNFGFKCEKYKSPLKFLDLKTSVISTLEIFNIINAYEHVQDCFRFILGRGYLRSGRR